jgi:predicted PurR-regulated permease PerM
MQIEDPRERQKKVVRIAAAALLVLLGLWIASGFLPALVWAVVIAIAIDPLQQRFLAKGRSRRARTTMAAVVTVVIASLVLVPLILSITEAARELGDVTRWITSAKSNGVPVPFWVEDLPFVGATLTRWWHDHLLTPQGASIELQHLQGAQWLARTRLIGGDALHRLVVFAFTLLTLFFLLRDRDTILDQCRRASAQLLGSAGERIGRQATLSVRGTIDGLVLVGIGEGAVMALVYLVLGVPHPLLLGVVTAVAAMIPFGAAFVFAIAALLLLVIGSVAGAIAVVVIGLVVVGIADHLVRPILIGGATRLPFLWVLIGILGGVETLGLLGLFVGPATMAVLMMLWRDLLGASEQRMDTAGLV